VESAQDVPAIERTGEFHGKYHILGGAINPLEGIRPEDLKIAELAARLSRQEVTAKSAGSDDSAVQELIIATNPSVLGEATARYLAQYFADFGVRITRLGLGLPIGADLEFADEMTLSRAFTSRQQV
jgi:recombination protein RecR